MFRRLVAFLLPFAPAFVAAAQYCSLKPPSDATGVSRGIGKAGDGETADVIASAWYPGWLAADFPPSSIPWDRYNAMTFAFATTTSDPSTLQLDDISQDALPEFVAQAKNNSVTALLSIGGWTGSLFFSPAVATAANRTAFVNAILGMVSKYNLDGIDFDWEYPGKQGIGCNRIDPADSANFLTCLQELRATQVGKDLVLTAAVGLSPFIGQDGAPMSDVAAFATVLDRIAIMNYDVWGSWSSSVGPNAPLDDSCAPEQAGSAVSAVKAWTTANFPASKITLGLAAYGHSFKVAPRSALVGNKLALYPPFQAAQPAGNLDLPADSGATDPCGNPEGVSGIFTFSGLVEGGFLTDNGTAATGIDYLFDTCSQTPFVYNENSQVMVSYDDAASFAAKGKFINDQGLAGFSVWDVTGDKNDILLNALHESMGIESVCE
ncbi:Glycoside hydrolase family 18 protein [Mycena kentingensis (nom. inval.)]|nr:Glycoside hydrolase family 18 protein [Mycena kentingensis (nom. inval.)]